MSSCADCGGSVVVTQTIISDYCDIMGYQELEDAECVDCGGTGTISTSGTMVSAIGVVRHLDGGF